MVIKAAKFIFTFKNYNDDYLEAIKMKPGIYNK